MTLVIDTSAILALLFNETHGRWVLRLLKETASGLYMSTVSLTEVVIRLREKQPTLAQQLQTDLFRSGIRFIAPNQRQAMVAADARLRFPINLGDCLVYALATARKLPILTLDADFKKVDAQIIFPT